MCLVAALLLAGSVAASCSSDGADRPEPTDGATADQVDAELVDDTACDDPDDETLTQLVGTVVVSDRFDDGHPQHLALAVEPMGSPNLIDGLEWLRIQDSALSRTLGDHVGSEVTVCGSTRTGYTGDTALTVVRIDVGGERRRAEVYVAPEADTSVVGTVVVVERYDDGHPRVLGIERADDGEPGDDTVVVAESNKARELRYRIGHRVEVVGELDGDALHVAAYTDLDLNPRVESGDGFRTSFLAGSLDRDGALMGGVEIDTLVSFDGRLFAGTSYRKNTQLESPDPPEALQVLALDESDGAWRVDFELRGEDAGNAPRMVSAETVRFETDADGARLDEPVELLAMAAGNGEVYLRGPGEQGQWTATGLPEVIAAASGDPRTRTDVRSVASTTDPVTGESHLYAGAGVGRTGAGGGIYRGAYSPDADGLIVWDPDPVHPVQEDRNPRVTGLSEAHGSLYATVGTDLLRREHGPDERWTRIWTDDLPSGLDSLRDVVAVEGPEGGPALLVTVEGVNSRIVRIDLSDDEPTVELELVASFPETLYGVAGYNGGRSIRRADGSAATLFGIMLHRPRSTPEPPSEDPSLGAYHNESSGLYLWRDTDGSYRANRIVDETLEVHPPLQGVRDVVTASPFADEEGVVYFGGFDHNDYLFHNTGWIMKAHVDDVAGSVLELGTGPR